MDASYARLNVRLPRTLLARFQRATEDRNENASALIRGFMLDYAAEWEREKGLAQSAEQLAARVALLEKTLKTHGLEVPPS